jgi:hypothetical protein
MDHFTYSLLPLSGQRNGYSREWESPSPPPALLPPPPYSLSNSPLHLPLAKRVYWTHYQGSDPGYPQVSLLVIHRCANWLFKVSLLIIHSVSTGTIIRYQTLFHPKVNQQFYYRGTFWLSKGEPTGHLKMSLRIIQR